MSTCHSFLIGLALALGLVVSLWKHPIEIHRALSQSPSIQSHSKVPVLPKPKGICEDFYQSVCYRTETLQDPTGVVHSNKEGEIIIRQITDTITHQNPKWKPNQIQEAVIAEIFNPKRKGRIQHAFRWVRNSMVRFIEKQPSAIFTVQEKAFLKARIQKTVLQLPPPGSTYSDEPDLLYKNEAYYERTSDGELRLRVGGAYIIIAPSWFNLVFTLAHELAHAIDPCEVKAAQFPLPSYNRLSTCFLTHELIENRQNRSECGSNDQLSETFADWVAVQIVSEALAHYATEFRGPQILNAAKNSLKDLCDDDADADTSLHLSPQIRIGSIFGHHPQIRRVLGCQPLPSPLAYCQLEPGIKDSK